MTVRSLGEMGLTFDPLQWCNRNFFKTAQIQFWWNSSERPTQTTSFWSLGVPLWSLSVVYSELLVWSCISMHLVIFKFLQYNPLQMTPNQVFSTIFVIQRQKQIFFRFDERVQKRSRGYSGFSKHRVHGPGANACSHSDIKHLKKCILGRWCEKWRWKMDSRSWEGCRVRNRAEFGTCSVFGP